MSAISDLYTLILRETNNPPLTDKDAELTYAELDGNFVKTFDALQAVLSGVNVEAYDAGATYDQYSTDVYQQFAGYDSKIWKAVYNGSPSAFSGETPAEGVYWAQVSLAQLLPNIMMLVELSNVAGRGMCPQFCTEWQSFTNQDLFTNPVNITGLPAPGVGKIIVPKFVVFALDAGGTAYDFDVNGLRIAFASAPTTAFGAAIVQSVANSATDVYRTNTITIASLIPNDGLVLTAAADATVGDGTYYVKVIYQIENAPF